MKEEKAKNKKRILYFLALAISVLLLAAATVLTVVFVTEGNNNVVEAPPTGNEPDDPNDPTGPSGPTTPDKPGEPDDPTGGGDTVKFVVPVAYSDVTEYDEIYSSKTLGWIYRHKGVDFAAEEGADVCAMANGKIEKISLNEKTGNYIIIDHGDGLKTLYRFVEPRAGLKEGDTVKMGEKIATVAAAYGSEAKDGAHLHLEIHLNGKPANPANYLELVSAEK